FLQPQVIFSGEDSLLLNCNHSPTVRSTFMLRLLGAPALALTVMTAAAPAAQAAHRYHHAGYRASLGYRHQFAHTGSHHQRFAHSRHRYFTGGRGVAWVGGGHVPGGRPSAWCGWYARSLVGHDPGAQYNLARNWAHWGRATRPHVGAMVVWAHHVGMI